jgi:hypothetical protein
MRGTAFVVVGGACNKKVVLIIKAVFIILSYINTVDEYRHLHYDLKEYCTTTAAFTEIPCRVCWPRVSSTTFGKPSGVFFRNHSSHLTSGLRKKS